MQWIFWQAELRATELLARAAASEVNASCKMHQMHKLHKMHKMHKMHQMHMMHKMHKMHRMLNTKITIHVAASGWENSVRSAQLDNNKCNAIFASAGGQELQN